MPVGVGWTTSSYPRADASATSLSRELGREVTPADVAPLLVERFEAHVGPSLRSTRASTAVPA
ncbi:MAG: hypothetical protein DI537_50175 [Stutzerimonas stutzeri]|nr:MAG: hypothetical protein DI537_50175 [Stutzerimonas stutzeri]